MSESDVTGLARSIEADLRKRADRERQRVTEGYFPSALEILGVSAAAMREVIRRHRPAWRGLSPRAVLALAEELRSGGTHEGRQCGYEIIEARKDAAALLDRETVEGLGAGNDNWASVDSFATKVAGPAWRAGRVPDMVVRAWAASEDRWWRRTALVSTVALNQKSRGGTGDAPRTLDICERLVGDRDDMVEKGLSWALRALAVRDPGAVRAFLDRHADGLGARVRREVRNKLETGRKSG
jgi:3-methyladenine DNA glycosylase AlkD